jgi:hypothetical protein
MTLPFAASAARLADVTMMPDVVDAPTPAAPVMIGEKRVALI